MVWFEARGKRPSGCDLESALSKKTHLLHDAGLALGKGDVAARLVADELDLNLATLAAALLVIVVVVVGSWARSLDAAALVRVAIAHRVRVVELRGRRLVVLVGDVGHVERLRLQLRQQL